MAGGSHTVILVYSTSHAMRIEKLLAERGIACKMIPVPRHISSDCGVCIRVKREDREAAQEAVAASGIEIQGIADV